MEIRRGDLVKMEGTEFHIRKSYDGVVSYWAKDVDMSYTETFDQFIDRARQSGGIVIEPGEGKFESPDKEDNRERYFETV
jgi:hypothetical protein